MKAVQFSEYGGPEVLRVVSRLCSEGLFHLRVEQTFPLEQTARAQEVSAQGQVTGKRRPS